MKVLHTIRNYFCYCGIEKDEYNALKKDAYISNFRVWRVLHIVMAAVFGILFAGSFFSAMMAQNRVFYMIAFAYSAVAVILFFRLKQDSLIAQLMIYLSISLLFVFGGLISQNKPDIPSTTFIVLLVITPMFMIDKPFFMAFELCAASAVFLVWMYSAKIYAVWRMDLLNAVIFTGVGVILHIIANSIRIKEFVLTRTINIQKDTDELTGLRNKGALTREINNFLADGTAGRGTMFLLDIDRFKAINDTYGQDVGDSVIHQLGRFLAGRFTRDEIVGRFGGDEFIVLIRDTDNTQAACGIAGDIIAGASESVVLPDREQKISISIGIAMCRGGEKNYSEIFKKADTALYRSKADPANRYRVYEEEDGQG